MRLSAQDLIKALFSAVVLCAAAGPVLSAQAPPFTVEFWGDDSDKVGRDSATPDGQRDFHLRVTLRAAVGGRIKAVRMAPTITPGSSLVDNWYWSTGGERGPYIIAVEVNGSRVANERLSEIALPATLDVYSVDTGALRSGSWAVMDVELANRTRVTSPIQLSKPRGRLVGRWQSLCQSPSGTAFEPQTSYGGLILDVAADGTVSGLYDTFPVAGRRMPNGALTATTQTPEGTIAIDGRVAIARDATLSGNGNIVLPANNPCFSATWNGE